MTSASLDVTLSKPDNKSNMLPLVITTSQGNGSMSKDIKSSTAVLDKRRKSIESVRDEELLVHGALPSASIFSEKTRATSMLCNDLPESNVKEICS